MKPPRTFSQLKLVNGSTGDPVLYVDYPGRNNALLFDAGDNSALPMQDLADLEAVFITHHHVDHFIGLDRIVRANIDQDKTLQVFGPPGTMTKVYDRIRSYEYQFFPFQKIVLDVHDIHPQEIHSGRLECTRRFPQPEVRTRPRSGRSVYDTPELTIESVAVDHTVECLAYALVEKPGWHVDTVKLEQGTLRRGKWVLEVLDLLQAHADLQTPLTIDGGIYPLATLRDQYFVRSQGSRLAWITDTAWTSETQPLLIELARGAWRLYCDSFYLKAQAKSAATHRHMTATAAAELAQRAKVEQLVLIHFAQRYVGQYHKLVAEAAAIFSQVAADFPGAVPPPFSPDFS